MPRLMGVSLVAVLAGAVAMYFIGFVIYGLLFQEVWAQQVLIDRGVASAEGAAALSGAALMAELEAIPTVLDPMVAMGVGFIISLATAAGMAAALKYLKPSSLGAAVGYAVLFWLAFAVTTLSYNVVYYSESVVNFGLDVVHMLLGYTAAAAVIHALDGRAMREPRATPDAGATA